MTRHRLILPTLLAATAAFAWGCTKPPSAAAPDKTKTLEARVAQLEHDVKGLAATRDALQQRLTATEERAAAAERDRDEARLALASRTAERDSIQTQYEAFRKGLRELLGTADTAAAQPMPAPQISSVSLPVPPHGGL